MQKNARSIQLTTTWSQRILSYLLCIFFFALRNKVELISINDYEKYFTGSLPITKITFEYILGYDKSVIPCWRFYIGSSEDEQNRFGEYILAVDAVSGKIIQERRRHTF